jgi:probable phosphoglycerate mutase
MRIYLIRHGRQESNLCNVNVALSQEGHEQARLTAERLRSYAITRLYASELLRAQQTAEHISQTLHLPIITAQDIEEIHFGAWTGKSDAELDAAWADARRAHINGTMDVQYPSGENGADCYERYRRGMEWILADAAAAGSENIAVVSHGMAMRAFLCGLFEIPYKKRGVLAKSLENGSISELRYENGVYYLERFNDYAHLEPYDELLRKHFK